MPGGSYRAFSGDVDAEKGIPLEAMMGAAEGGGAESQVSGRILSPTGDQAMVSTVSSMRASGSLHPAEDNRSILNRGLHAEDQDADDQCMVAMRTEQRVRDRQQLRQEKTYTEEYAKCVLVTGGVGFVGSHIAAALLEEGRRVVVYDIFNAETTGSEEKKSNASLLERLATENSGKGATLKIVNGDIRDQEHVMAVISEEGITGCVHVGGMVDDRRSVRFPEEYIDVNILGTALLLDALGKCGVRMVVQASTRSVFGQCADNSVLLDEDAPRRPINPYGASKVAADAMAHCYSHLHNMNVTLVRIFATYGPRGRPDMIPRILIENVHHGRPINKFGDGTATRTWIYVSDIVSAFLLALKHPQEGFAEFNTGAPNSTTLNELISIAEKVVGKEAIIEHHPPPPGDAHTVGHPSYTRIQEALGWQPKVGVEQGMKLVYDDYVTSSQ